MALNSFDVVFIQCDSLVYTNFTTNYLQTFLFYLIYKNLTYIGQLPEEGHDMCPKHIGVL